MKKNNVNIICCVLFFAILFGCMPYFEAHASEFDRSLIQEDRVVLTVGIGSRNGEIKYSDTLQGGGEGPEAFTVTAEEVIYIVDNVNKRVNVYKDDKFLYGIETPYISYVRSIVVSQDLMYLMDYDAGKIYVLDIKGNMVKDITIPQDMENYLMHKLYTRKDGGVWLYYENNINGDEGRGIDFSYNVEDLFYGIENSIQGFTKDGEHKYSVGENKIYAAFGNTMKEDSIRVNMNDSLADIKILNIDKNNCVYVDMFEMVDTSIVAGEYTVRKYSNGRCEGIAPIDLGEYYFMPNNVLEVSEEGDLYQLKCYTDKVQIIKKAFVNSENFESNILGIREKTLALEAKSNELAATAAVINVPNTVATTTSNAAQCCALSWTYNSANANNPNSSNVSTPDYLVNATKPSSQTGIPYCWGGFDGLNTSSSTAWSSFSTAMSNNKFAGNVNTSTAGYQTGTAGFDCSGFVSSAAGFSSKLGTSHLASSTYTTSVSLQNRSLYDIYVKSGTHVLYYVGASTDGIKSREATTTGDDKTKMYTRSSTWLSGYSLRRYNGW